MPRSAANKSEENCTNGDKDDDRRMGERRTRKTAAAAAADFSRTINVSLIYRLVVTARQNVARHFLYIWKHNTTPCNTYSLRPTTSGCTARSIIMSHGWMNRASLSVQRLPSGYYKGDPCNMDRRVIWTTSITTYQLLACYTTVFCDNVMLVMVALWNRETIYIFILFLLLLLLFFARLISAVGDWMSTILRHMVWS